MSVAGGLSESELVHGGASESGHVAGTGNGSAAEVVVASELHAGGAPPRHIDLETALLDRLARSWLDVQQTRKALAQRELDDKIVGVFLAAEQQLSRQLSKTLRQHPLWPWLSQFPGLGGAHTAVLIGRIGDPRRFPGQRCSEGHYLPPLYAVGAACPIAELTRESDASVGDGADLLAETPSVIERRPGETARADEAGTGLDATNVCPGVMLAARTTTGVRSLWHWAGLHVLDNGRAPRKTKGQRADWEPRARASVMQPGGIAEQIVRLTVPVYSDIYRDAKARLILRVAEKPPGSDEGVGDAISLRAAGLERESGLADGRPLRLFEADRIARKVAAKAFLGDLLTEWKRLVADDRPEIELVHGDESLRAADHTNETESLDGRPQMVVA